MVTEKRNLYYIGYLAGYRDGVKDATEGKATLLIESDITKLPITIMQLSVRAKNCLARANCEFIEDVALLSEHALATMRNLGPKTAREIAHWLDDHGICYTAWSRYL